MYAAMERPLTAPSRLLREYVGSSEPTLVCCSPLSSVTERPRARTIIPSPKDDIVLNLKSDARLSTPGWSKAVKSATLEAACSSTQGE